MGKEKRNRACDTFFSDQNITMDLDFVGQVPVIELKTKEGITKIIKMFWVL
jgi:hypothetical protein